jgi:hypothetical protein
MKIRPVVAELFYADAQADKHDEAFRNFTKESKKAFLSPYSLIRRPKSHGNFKYLL